MNTEEIAGTCQRLASQKTRGELGGAIAGIVLSYSPRDLQRMRWNFSGKIQDMPPELRKKLEETITGHLQGTYQALRLMNQQGTFSCMDEPPAQGAGAYWKMVEARCSAGDAEKVRLRFLKFLLSGFCMFVQLLPGHPVGMPFPGGEKVKVIDGVYYCPVREKANDVDSALCPFCPALQTPEIGYLKPPVDSGRHRKEEFLRQTFERHHYNG
ncbi:MAG TPA: DUF2115 domain-containing protein [Methanoregulaceae archaeon]|nr:MAG: DUF2115 domain-containing protein [Methanolinea sp.]HON81860.1 DUF2115 domain-containing protein [Methanoregulaceae archaeon]HPD10634.1 DUF2115 domain-containing protein [Methanoregulaceae archaeon]HRT15765.1 DUF2115 domain-containing protein [Methanoregulaceae archaeon]HRU31279.1 DUF2115 domain-containing protein [Methanoregulaceae archaeon]